MLLHRAQSCGPGIIRALSPVAWYRLGVGITIATGVSQWDDQSGNGRHLVQATGTKQPALQADGSILFDGAADFLKTSAFTLNQPNTVYVLGRQVTWALNDFIFAGNSVAAADARIFQSAVTPAINGTAGLAMTANSDLAVNTYGVLAVSFNGASSLIQVNNNAAVTSNAGTNPLAGFTLGSNADGTAGWGNIQVKEVILFPAAHDAATRARVIGYLAAVGGLSI